MSIVKEKKRVSFEVDTKPAEEERHTCKCDLCFETGASRDN